MTNSHNTLIAALIVLLPCAPVWAQSKPPAPVVGITSAEIEAVLKHVGPEGGGTDRQIKVADLGSYKRRRRAPPQTEPSRALRWRRSHIAR